MMRIINLIENTSIVKYLRTNHALLIETQQKLDGLHRQNRELLFANIFRDSIQDSSWLTDKSFSPFQAAANYSLMYKLFKIYDVYKPKNILEFGLGQSTRLTAQYVASDKTTKALVIDDNDEWIRIYSEQIVTATNLQIKKLSVGDFEYENIKSKEGEYKGLKDTIKKDKFDLVIIDGPIGHLKEYSRTNIISLIDNLAKTWVVIFDDAERQGEQNTIALFKKELEKKNIDSANFVVSALKSQHFFCSQDIASTIHDI